MLSLALLATACIDGNYDNFQAATLIQQPLKALTVSD